MLARYNKSAPSPGFWPPAWLQGLVAHPGGWLLSGQSTKEKPDNSTNEWDDQGCQIQIPDLSLFERTVCELLLEGGDSHEESWKNLVRMPNQPRTPCWTAETTWTSPVGQPVESPWLQLTGLWQPLPEEGGSFDPYGQKDGDVGMDLAKFRT